MPKWSSEVAPQRAQANTPADNLARFGAVVSAEKLAAAAKPRFLLDCFEAVELAALLVDFPLVDFFMADGITPALAGGWAAVDRCSNMHWRQKRLRSRALDRPCLCACACAPS